MLQEMRKYTKSWIANILLGLLTLSFVSWGVGDILSARIDTSVAKVGGKTIEQREFTQNLQNAMKAEGARRGGASLTADEARKIGLSKTVLEQDISDAALDNVAHDQGLVVSDTTLTALIQRAPVFAGLTGQFDRQVFIRFAERQGYSEQGFIQRLRDDLARNQLTRAVEDGFTLPPGYVRLLISYFFEQRAADYIVVDDKALGPVPPPPDATLAAFVKAHADQFSTPEYRDVSYAWIAPTDVQALVKVTDEQIKQAYDEHKAEYVVSEKRDVQQLLFTSETAAKGAYDKIAKGTKFDDLTNDKGEKPTPQTALTVEDLDAGAAKAVFALTKDGVATPQKLASGKWALFKVTAITPGLNRTLDQVKEDLRKKVAIDLATSKLTDISNAYTDASSSGLSMTDAAKKVGMHSGRIAAMDVDGLGPDGKKTAAPDDQEFRNLVFHTEAGEEGDPQTMKSGVVYVVSVNGATPPKLKPLAEVRDKALAAWMVQERARLLKQKVQDLTAQVNRAGTLDNAAKAIGVTVQKSPPLQHGFTDDAFSSTVVESLFKVGPNQAAFGPKAKGGGYVIARVTAIAHPQLPEKSPQFLAISQQLASRVGATLGESYVAQQRADQKVVYNKKNIDSVEGTEAQ